MPSLRCTSRAWSEVLLEVRRQAGLSIEFLGAARDDLKPLLSGKPWRSAFELLQDAIGDESRKEGRLVHQWVVGLLDTESFIELLASVILSYVRVLSPSRALMRKYFANEFTTKPAGGDCERVLGSTPSSA